MDKFKITLSDVAANSGLVGKDKAEKKAEKARFAVCKIAHGQDQGGAECGVLVYDPKVDDHELSKHCIITVNDVVNLIENKNFEKGKYEVTFRHKNKQNKQFDLQDVTKVVRNASGLVLIFINSSCKELKKCSILSESCLSIAAPDHSSKSSLFCFIENQRYNVVESTDENGEKCVDVFKSASDSPKEIPHGTVILQYDAHDKNVMAVGIFKVVSKEHLKISPIWFKSSLNDVLGRTGADEIGVCKNGKRKDATENEDVVKDRERQPASLESANSATAAAAAAADGETSNCVNTDSTAARLAAASSPSTAADGDLQNSIDHEDALSERSENRNSQQQQSLTTFPTQVEPESTAYREPTVTAGEETPQQEEPINYENFLVSEKINGDRFIQDKLSINLDWTSHRIIKNWEHLACTDEINAPLKVRLKCKLVGQKSCTKMLFDVLTSEFGDKTVKDLIDALTRINRNDVIKIITDAYPDAAGSAEKFSDFVACLENSAVIEKIATRLDKKSPVLHNWLHLGQQFKVSDETLEEIEYGPFSPTEVLMKSLYSRKTDLTIGEFYDEVKKLKRQDVLKKLDPFIVEASDRDKPMKNVIGLESDAMRSICISLDNPNRRIKNWRHLCHSPALGIPEDVYKECQPAKKRSPTDLLFEWIFGNKVDLTVGQLCSALAKIDRNDIVRDVREYFDQNSLSHLGQS